MWRASVLNLSEFIALAQCSAAKKKKIADCAVDILANQLLEWNKI